jgi:hypothetical protein
MVTQGRLAIWTRRVSTGLLLQIASVTLSLLVLVVWAQQSWNAELDRARVAWVYLTLLA